MQHAQLLPEMPFASQLSTLVSLRIAPLAVVCSKLASSSASPASAMAKRMASALYSLIACSKVLKLPAGQVGAYPFAMKRSLKDALRSVSQQAYSQKLQHLKGDCWVKMTNLVSGRPRSQYVVIYHLLCV